MKQIELVEEGIKLDARFTLGRCYVLHLPRGPRRQGDLYHHGSFIKRVNLADKAELRLFAVELMQKSLSQTRLAEVLNLSRQTLHNYRESYREFGVNGLLNGYSPSRSKSEELQRRVHVDKRRPGSKARELEVLRRDKKTQTTDAVEDEFAWNGKGEAIYALQEPAIEEVLRGDRAGTEVMPDADQSFGQSTAEQPLPTAIAVLDELAVEGALGRDEASTRVIPDMNLSDIASLSSSAIVSEVPYADKHGWEVNRHAGVFPILMVLIGQPQWMQRLFRLFGNGWRIFMVFALMAVSNIRSIEQMKHERRDEVGRLLGLGRLPALDTLWSWFYDAAGKHRAGVLLKEFFADQIRCGLVGTQLWYTDGHLLPYTGQDKVHAAWNTQRRMPMPGQTNLVTCDEQGRVVYFDIQEGHGDLRTQILKLGEYARHQSLGIPPVHVFDREGDGLGFFSEMVRSATPFITWEKNANQTRLMALAATDFIHSVQVNGTDYRLLEQIKACTYKPVAVSGVAEPEHRFELRRVVMWNLRTDHRVSVLCSDTEIKLSPQEVATGMLGRWGASENTFKHIQARHPYHYHPGFGVAQSEKQDIANPQIKVLEQQISTLQKQLANLYKKHTKTKPSFNRDGSERMNSLHRRLTDAIAANEERLNELKADKAKLPERVDVEGLSDYRSFKAIDNEGKNLFDFVTTSVWNARRVLLDWLGESYAKDSDRVDLLYAILNCQGWIHSDEQWVVVRMEPLQQPARRYAQEHLCRKLTGLGAKIPGGKWLRVEVGDSPI
jgi:hypothetical protein